MKKAAIVLFLLTGCATAPEETPAPKTDAPAAAVSGAAEPASPSPLQRKEGETPQAFIERQIAMLDGEIVKLEPSVIAAVNRVDPEGPIEAARLKKKLFALEREKANLELQLMSLPEK